MEATASDLNKLGGKSCNTDEGVAAAEIIYKGIGNEPTYRVPSVPNPYRLIKPTSTVNIFFCTKKYK